MQKFSVIIIGILFLGIGTFLYIKNDNLKKNCTEKTQAIVVDMKEELSTDSDDTINYVYYPIIEYKVNGKIIRATMDEGSSNPAYNINQKITILYNPNKTSQFIVKGDKTSTIMSYIFIIIGILITGYGIVVALKKDKIK